MATLYKTDGTFQEITPKNGTDFKLEELYELIGCELVEMIGLEEEMCMLTDEEGKIKRQEINPEATDIWWKSYPYARNYDCIVGNAVVCHLSQFR